MAYNHLSVKRQPFGETPLYYSLKGPNGFVCGNSVRELLEKGVPRKLSKKGLFSYLAYGCVYHPYTLIEDIWAIPPGCEVGISNDEAIIKRYWTPSFKIRDWRPGELQHELDMVLLRSVGSQVTDNPAAFLSGGIDSSSIVALWRKQYDGEIRTYCVTHEDERTDERKWARMVADRNHTKHTELMLEGRMIREWLDEAVASYDQPSVDGLNFWFATRLLKEAGEKVVLSGEGGDELFMGYWRFIKHQMAYKYAPIMRHLPKSLGRLLDAIAPNEKVRKLAMLSGFKGEPYYVPRRILSDWQIQKLVRPELTAGASAFEDLDLTGYSELPTDTLNRISYLELQTVVADMWNRDGYQTSVANGIDVRTPLLNTELAELLFTVPGKMKCDDSISKPLLVSAAGDGLPLECVTRKKQGFALPFDRYFSSDIKDRIDSFLSGDDCRIFRPDSIRNLGRRYRDGKIYWSRIWAPFMVENWCKVNGIEI